MQRQLQPIETAEYAYLQFALNLRENQLLKDLKVDLEIAVLNQQRSERFSGLLRQIIYPEYVSLYEVRDEDINRYLVSHPKVLAKDLSCNKFLFEDITIYRGVEFVNCNWMRNVLNTKFISKNQIIKSITLDEVLIYSSPFVDSRGIFRGFETNGDKEKAREVLFQLH